MNHIIYLALLGAFSGMIASFWTRIIKPNMIFYKIGRRLNKIDDMHVIQTTKHSGWVKFLNCVFCLSPWLCIAFDVVYIVIYTPEWYFCIMGVPVSWGAGNFVVEIVYSLRDRQ